MFLTKKKNYLKITQKIQIYVDAPVKITCIKVINQSDDNDAAIPAFNSGGIGFNWVGFFFFVFSVNTKILKIYLQVFIDVFCKYSKGFDFYIEIFGKYIKTEVDSNTI